MKSITVKQKFVTKFQNGYPLLFKEAVDNAKSVFAHASDGELFHLLNPNHKYIATAYYGVQNKGLGWLLTDKKDDIIDNEFFRRRVSRALRDRENLFNSRDTNVFRVINGEGDLLPGMTVDYYNGYCLINCYNKGIYSYLDIIAPILLKHKDVNGIYNKNRFDTGGRYIEDDDYLMGEKAEFPIIVKENNVNYSVYFNDGAMTGLFIDQRNIRKHMMNNFVKDKTILNTFSYTGAFSVAATIGGASKTTSIDLAKRTKEKTQEMFTINDIDHTKHDIIIEDVFNYFKYARRKELKFDTIILDPPSFSRAKKNTFSAAKDYPRLIEEAITVSEKDGVIIASTNCSTFDMKEFLEMINEGFSNQDRKFSILRKFSLPEDFTILPQFIEGNYLKVVFLKLDQQKK